MIDIYLCIITTALVATQIIRLIQNTISLNRMSKQIQEVPPFYMDNLNDMAQLVIRKLETKNDGTL